MAVDVTIRIAGQAGQGIQSISAIMGKIFTRNGYYVFINQDAESRIRGGHNFDQVRIKDQPVYAIRDRLDYLICLDENTIEQDLGCLDQDGIMIYDGTQSKFKSDNPNFFFDSARANCSGARQKQDYGEFGGHRDKTGQS